jgi:NaMN:DMB phosphoribosyltransferase
VCFLSDIVIGNTPIAACTLSAIILDTAGYSSYMPDIEKQCRIDSNRKGAKYELTVIERSDP